MKVPGDVNTDAVRLIRPKTPPLGLEHVDGERDQLMGT